MYKEYFEKYRLSKDNFDNVEYELWSSLWYVG
jgi:hypothetical protein